MSNISNIRFGFICIYFCELDFVPWPNKIKFNHSMNILLHSIEFENQTLDVIRWEKRKKELL